MSYSDSRDGPRVQSAMLGSPVSRILYSQPNDEQHEDPCSNLVVFIDELPPPDVWYNDEEDVVDHQNVGWSWDVPISEDFDSHWSINEQAQSPEWAPQVQQFEQQPEPAETFDEQTVDTAQHWGGHRRSQAVWYSVPPVDSSTSMTAPLDVLQLLRDNLRAVMRLTQTLQRASWRHAGRDLCRREAMLFNTIDHLVTAVEQQQQFDAALHLAIDLGRTGEQRRTLSVRYLTTLIDH